ncbi:aminoglycoside phosphotransferase family protein [Umezawaea sp. Da 62-37]|uniref:aminoglycoside phosphotransferase family protein n=1 Tax=Umezawaea sp. Da 62-37 TaxID=3075927 RepID=UPI0028F6D529|nr:aminoglycoside phosphotransferase family protein [Umezawaea sp. Da 62-37]WNV86808.1 aminoglycoside phosphotransferase family protein [Umezawaea sp. Da 62-37]
MDALPERVDRLTRRWDLTVVRPLPGGTSHTLFCHRGGTTPVVLKVIPDPDIAVQEHAALTRWADTPNVVDLVDADLDEGALLLEGLLPGGPARTVTAGQVAELLDALHRPPADGFRPLADRIDLMFTLLRRRVPGYYDRAHAAALELAEDPVPKVLLHGDLHPGNVLDAGPRGLVAIDPRPCAGDPAFDAVDHAFEGEDLYTRVQELSGVVDGDRLLAWCRALSVFSPAWHRVIHPGGR